MFSSIVFITATSLMNPLLSATSPLSSAVAAFQAPSTLNLTSMGVSKGVSIMECWQLDNVFEETNQIGVPGLLQLQLGDLANMSYTVIPPKYFPPLHNAPNVQYGLFLSGLAHIYLPSGKHEVYLRGGIKHGLVFFTDVAAVSTEGHFTTYPGDEETILLQVPTNDCAIPPHKVLYEGPCTDEEEGI